MQSPITNVSTEPLVTPPSYNSVGHPIVISSSRESVPLASAAAQAMYALANPPSPPKIISPPFTPTLSQPNLKKRPKDPQEATIADMLDVSCHVEDEEEPPSSHQVGLHLLQSSLPAVPHGTRNGSSKSMGSQPSISEPNTSPNPRSTAQNVETPRTPCFGKCRTIPVLLSWFARTTTAGTGNAPMAR